MNNNLLIDFTFDKAAKTISITREFNARQSLVSEAFTKREIQDKWAAPAPRCETNTWILKLGRRFYALISPDGKNAGCSRNTLLFYYRNNK